MLKIDKIRKMKAMGVHDGTFHADDVFSVAFIKLVNEEIKVIRSRKLELLKECDILVDVSLPGERSEFDHHFYEKKYRSNGVPYCGFGLLWNEYGKDFFMDKGFSEEDSEEMKVNIDKTLVLGMDAGDNAYISKRAEQTLSMEFEDDYTMYSVFDTIYDFNPQYDSDETEDEMFFVAVKFATRILKNIIIKNISLINAKGIVRKALKTTKGNVMFLESSIPWQKPLIDMDINKRIKIVVYPDTTGGYKVQAVPNKVGSFVTRYSFPKEWCAKEGDELFAVTCIKDFRFCHAAGFLCVTNTLESAKEILKKLKI